MNGVNWRVRREEEKVEKNEDEEREISREEFDRVLNKLKGKAADGDGIVNEVWKFGGKEARKWLKEICNRV